jgi:glucosamine kinase
MQDRSHPPILPLQAAAAPRPVRWLVGVDGGGTHTRARLARRDGSVVGEGHAGPSALGQGVAQAWRHVADAVGDAAAQAGLPAPDWADCALGAGLSGACVEAQARAFLAANPGCAQLLLDSDGFAGVLGAFSGAPGALLVAGTGSVCEALRGDGSRACVGGWGWKTGDEGSGAWIGKEALRHAQRALDGRDAAGPLARALWREIGDEAEALLAWAQAADQPRFAALAPWVFEHAPHDTHARGLLQVAARELEALAHAVDPAGTLPLALAGSVAQRLAGLALYSPRLHERLVTPRGDATAGALFMIGRVVNLQEHKT